MRAGQALAPGDLSGQVDVGLGAWGILAPETLREAPCADEMWPRPSGAGARAAHSAGCSQRFRDGRPGIVALSPLPGQRAPLAPATVLGPRLRGTRSGLAPAAPPHSAPVGPEHGDTRHVASSVASCLQRAPPRPPRSALLTVTATGHCPWGVPCWQGAGLRPCTSGAHGVARCAVSRYGLCADQLAHLCRLVCPSPLPEADRGHCLCREGSRHGGGAWRDLRHLIAGG